MKNKPDKYFCEIPKILLNLISGVMVDGVLYKNIGEWAPNIKEGENVLTINPIKSNSKKIVVKQCALKDTPYFKFNELFNQSRPIPMTEMYGVTIEDSDKMVKMDLWDKNKRVHWIGWVLKNWIVSEENI